ncbi:MAG: hypothetical protein WA864_09595 [Acetobacteraceae bacterium]
MVDEVRPIAKGRLHGDRFVIGNNESAQCDEHLAPIGGTWRGYSGRPELQMR